MRKEAVKTALFVVVALSLTALAAWVEPEARTPEIFSDQGELLLPKLTDVLSVRSIEIIDYDESEAVARPLKVEMRKGRWVLPSHYDYPAEADGQLAKTVAALLGVKRDVVVSGNASDHAQFGVVDPLDSKVATLKGRGKRITLKDAGGAVLADLIEGYPVPDKPGYRYVRIPGEKRTYAVKTDADPSARFEDWAGGRILQLNPAEVRRIVVNAYTIDEQMGRMSEVQRSVLLRQGDAWILEGGAAANAARVNAILAALSNLRIAGVRPKPPSLAAMLRSGAPLEISLDTMLSLRERGYFLSTGGRLLSNSGEMSVETVRGVVYSLRFGEVASGGLSGDSSNRQMEAGPRPPAVQDESRYLWVMARYDGGLAAKYGGKDQGGEQLARALSSKFADWYYIIHGDQYKQLRALPDQIRR